MAGKVKKRRWELTIVLLFVLNKRNEGDLFHGGDHTKPRGFGGFAKIRGNKNPAFCIYLHLVENGVVFGLARNTDVVFFCIPPHEDGFGVFPLLDQKYSALRIESYQFASHGQLTPSFLLFKE